MNTAQRPDGFDRHILEAFWHQCQRRAEHAAVEHDGRVLNYRELDGYSAQIAKRLLEQGVQPGDRVGLCLLNTLHAVAAMLACMRVQAVFVPLDPNNPADRTRYMVDDAGIRHALCSPQTQPALSVAGLTAIVLSDDLITCSPCAPSAVIDLDALAYIMYTSGSTGVPKGVRISHRALAHYCRADAEAYGLSEDDRTLQFSTLSFDIAIEEIFPPLCTGGTVVMRPAERSESQVELSEIISRHNITCLHIATGYWHEWVDLMAAFAMRVPPSVRLMLVTGEKVSSEHYRRWRALCDHDTLWVNAYGPTETTVTATAFMPEPEWDGSDLPIGKPLPGYSALILNEDGEEVETGETGELCIGGPCLADGYLNKPEQTRNAFVPHPAEPGARLYRTGDLARWLDDGNIAYAGRIDHQIKVGSYRVEPGEIENTINTLPGVLESVVAALKTEGRTRLLAYVAHGGKTLDLNALAQHLTNTLPDYMVPNHYILLDRFTKTSNGKIDRDQLPDPASAVSPKRRDYVAPRTDTEFALQSIWLDVLDVPDVGIEDSFFTLGGESLTAARVIAQMQSTLGKTLSSRDFFSLETIGMMAGQLDGKATQRVLPPPSPAFVNTVSRQLYTVLQRPRPAQTRSHGLLIVPPLGNEQRRIQRPMRSFMQHFARNGYTLLRFDWTGTANSSGDARTLTDLQQWQEDIGDAARQLCDYVECFDLIAFRLGALLAAQHRFHNLVPRHRIYCEPVMSGADWLDGQRKLQHGILADTYRFLRPRSKRDSERYEFSGLELNPAIFSAIEALSLNTSPAITACTGFANVILPSGQSHGSIAGLNQLVTTDDNSWYHPRQTNADMQLQQSARLIAELIDQKRTSPGDSVQRRTHAA